MVCGAWWVVVCGVIGGVVGVVWYGWVCVCVCGRWMCLVTENGVDRRNSGEPTEGTEEQQQGQEKEQKRRCVLSAIENHATTHTDTQHTHTQTHIHNTQKTHTHYLRGDSHCTKRDKSEIRKAVFSQHNANTRTRTHTHTTHTLTYTQTIHARTHSTHTSALLHPTLRALPRNGAAEAESN